MITCHSFVIVTIWRYKGIPDCLEKILKYVSFSVDNAPHTRYTPKCKVNEQEEAAMQIKVTMRNVETEETTEHTFEYDSIWEAMDDVVWQYGEDYWILAIEYVTFPDDWTDWDGRWVLTDTFGTTDVKYASKDEAMANADTGAEVLIAVPNKG